MAAQIQLRRDTTANWTSVNPVLAAGEPGYDTTLNVLKIGDGQSSWTQLTSTDGSTITTAKLNIGTISNPAGISIQSQTPLTDGSLPADPDWGTYYFTAHVVGYDAHGNHTDSYGPDYNEWDVVSYNAAIGQNGVKITWLPRTGVVYYRVYFITTDLQDNYLPTIYYVQVPAGTTEFNIRTTAGATVGSPPAITDKYYALNVAGRSSLGGPTRVNGLLDAWESDIVARKTVATGVASEAFSPGLITIDHGTSDTSYYGAHTAMRPNIINSTWYDPTDDTWYPALLDMQCSRTFMFDGANTIQFPAGQGSNRFVLTTNGAGNTYWSYAPSGTQYYRANTSRNLNATSTGNQSILGLTNGVTITAGQNLIYEIEGAFVLNTTGTTSHTESFGFVTGGVATAGACSVVVTRMPNQVTNSFAAFPVSSPTSVVMTTVTPVPLTGSINTAQNAVYTFKGHLTTTNASAGGITIRPVIVFSAGTAGSISAGAWMTIRQVGTYNTDIAIGTWS